jgi:3-mercaptopyruvate sulfurtransferase SseA
MKPLILGLMLAGAAILAAQQPTSQSAPPPSSQGTPVPEDQRVAADAIDKLLADGQAILLDVREPKELEELGTREGYINIPIGELEGRLSELPKDKTILTA